jgi:large repetitive protein
VTLTGANFLSGARVVFGGTAANSVVVVSATQITANTPPHAPGSFNVTVINPLGRSGALANGFTFVELAPVTSVSPNTGTTTGGTPVTLTGENFVSGARVTIGGTAANSVVVVSDTQITATTPPHRAGVVNVVVTDPDGDTGTLANGFTFLAPASTVTGVSPASGTPPRVPRDADRRSEISAWHLIRRHVLELDEAEHRSRLVPAQPNLHGAVVVGLLEVRLR